jgi:hypothetical protein
VKFASLPENIQREYGFDPLKATAFEASQAKAQGVLQAKMQADYKDATNRLAKRLAKEDEEWQAEQAVAQAKLRAEQAAAQAKLFAEQMAAEEKLAVQAALAGGTAWLAENGNPYSEVSVRTPESIAQAQQIQQWSPAAAQGDVQAAANLAQAKAAATQGFTPGEADIEWRRQQAGYVPNQYQPPGANGLFPNRPAQSGPLPASGNAAPTAGRK